MVTRSHVRSANVFGAIADPTRRAILDVLRAGERSAGQVADQFPVSRPAVSRHLRILRRAGLLRARQHLRARFYSLDGRALRQVDEWLKPYRLFLQLPNP
jgi:DNA-binding transcriptional ArsR family regulator